MLCWICPVERDEVCLRTSWDVSAYLDWALLEVIKCWRWMCIFVRCHHPTFRASIFRTKAMISYPKITATVHRRKLSSAHTSQSRSTKEMQVTTNCFIIISRSLFRFLLVSSALFLIFIFLFRSLSISLLSPSIPLFFSVKEWALIKIYLFLSVKLDSHCTRSHHYAMSTKQNLLLFVLFSSVTHSLPCERSNSSTIALTKEKHAKASFPSLI